MAEEILVDRKLEDGKTLIRELRARNFDVSAAFWMKVDDGFWYLYLVSKAGDGADAYMQLSLAMREIPESSIDVFDLKLVGANEPLAQEVLGLQRNFKLNLYSSHRLRKVGPMRSGDAYIYPLVSIP